jgi:hypothetical protein
LGHFYWVLYVATTSLTIDRRHSTDCPRREVPRALNYAAGRSPGIFQANHVDPIVAADFFVVPTATYRSSCSSSSRTNFDESFMPRDRIAAPRTLAERMSTVPAPTRGLSPHFEHRR